MTPPAHPRPKIGKRRTSGRNGMTCIRRASSDGVAMPMEQTVTIVSIWPGVRPASSKAFRAASAISANACSRNRSLRSEKLCGCRYQSIGTQECRVSIRALR